MTDQGLLPEIAQHGSHFLPLNFTLYSLLPNDVNIIFYLTYVSSLSCILIAAVSAVLKKSAVFLIYAK